MLVQCRTMIRDETIGRSEHAGSLRIGSVLLLIAALLTTSGVSFGQDAKSAPAPAFAEADAVRVLDQLRRSLEANNPGRFLKTFDARRMPGYPAFRDQVAEFFERYDAFVVRYHLTQVSMDGALGATLADFEFDAHPRDGVTPNVRQRVQLRLVCAWDGRQWKIVDLTPRDWIK